jgi:hypothetical protein
MPRRLANVNQADVQRIIRAVARHVGHYSTTFPTGSMAGQVGRGRRKCKSQFAAPKDRFLLGRYHPSSHVLDASRNPTKPGVSSSCGAHARRCECFP